MVAVFGTFAWLGGNAATAATTAHVPWAPFQPVDAALHPDRAFPHLSPSLLLISTRLAPALLSIALGAAGLLLWSKHRRKPTGLAGRSELAPLLPAEITAKARDLRPSLSKAKPREINPDDTGILLGDLAPSGPEIRSNWEDVAVAIMAPRSGKTTSIAVPAILRAPGPVLLTSNKAARDAYTACLRGPGRGRAGVDDGSAADRPHPTGHVVGHPRRRQGPPGCSPVGRPLRRRGRRRVLAG
nr:hypothetical protein KPHV_47810 [Kitasatospora purpeofusca]